MKKILITQGDYMKQTYIKTSYFNLLLFSGNETATTASFNMIAVFFMLMLTDNLLLSAIIGGFIFAGSRVVDAFSDPLIGTLIDKTTTRFGRYRPFIILGSFMLNLGILAIFGGFFIFESDILMYVWIIFWYLFYIIGYTFQSACTRSAQTILTNHPTQRPVLGALLAGFSYLFYGLFLVFSIAYVESFDGGFSNPLGYRNLAFFVVSVNLLLTTLSVIGLRKSDRFEVYTKIANNAKINWKSIFSLVRHNTPLRALIVAAGTNKLAQLITATSMVYFFTYTALNIGLQQVVATYGLIFGIIGVLVGVFAAKWFDRKFSFLLGTYLGLLFPIIIVIIHPFSQRTQWLLIFLLVAIIFATAIASTNVLPLIADVADYEFFKRGNYIPSTVGTTFSLVDKLISSLSGVFLAVALAFSEYVPNMEPTPRAFWAFYVMVIIVPALGHVASIIAFKYYPINRGFYEKMISEGITS
jgi:Na+/melibiose symporter-like transporter